MAQVTDAFKKAINDHLHSLAKTDALFAETLKKPNKKIDDCCTYILNQVKKTGKSGFADEEIFAMAVHYYDEDDIKVGDKVNGSVVVNHHIEAMPKGARTIPMQTAAKQDKPAKIISKNHVPASSSLFD